MEDLLLDESEFQYAIEELKQFAKRESIDIDLSNSLGLVTTITAILVAVELDAKSIAMLSKLVYNIGYRDNLFKSRYIH